MSKTDICSVCTELDFPQEAQDALLSAYEKLCASPDALRLMKVNSCLFWNDFYTSAGAELDAPDKISELTGIHKYTVYELFYILNYHEAKERFQQTGIGDEIFHDSMMELKYKMLITHHIYGVWGSAFADWYANFFRQKRFCIGRLEFELEKCFSDYRNGEHSIRKGEPIINVHIPEAGPLEPESVREAFRKAAEFYGDCFFTDVIPFECLSWILYPPIMELYPEKNLKKFASCFDVVKTEENQEHDDRWRIFEVPVDMELKDYPERTTLQQSVKKWLLDENTMGIGEGIFFLKDGEVLPH